ncbi:dihydropteroate synthase [Salegentibacter chungangensis]|uniref:dihydropteroate synthase n=1 Tax=Salegentibacter chungangensis TaxID=1335724 RepID=A0ABW3NRU5_9FLAO
MTINCKGQLIDLSSPKIMGILNTTPDSFYEGSRSQNESDLLKRAEKMLKEGADFIDIGGYSSRPDAEEVSVEEELQRVVPAIEALVKNFPEILISVDTFRSKVADESLKAGGAMVNDIAAGNLDKEMMNVVAGHQVPYIMMHMRGNPATMKKLNQYENMLQEILQYFSGKIREARSAGINDLMIDPGFGFSKNIEQNFELLSKADLFQTLELPVLIGISRKSMIYKTLGTNPSEALNGTTVLNSIALQKGASILRVHDVKEAVECVNLVSRVKK